MIVGLKRASLSFFVFGVSMLEMLSNQSAIKRKRLSVLLCVLALLALYLLFTLFRLQIIAHGAYEEKVIEQITVGSSLSAARGTIYDRNGSVLAANQTVYRIYISPIDIKKGIKRRGVAYDEQIARGLAEILGVSYDSVYKKAQKSAYLDQTVKRNVDGETAKAVLLFAKENGLSSMVHAEAGVRRYYPHGSLAAHVIGFAGSDGQGLFGLEAYYNDVLTGTDGKYMSAVDSQGIRLPLSYSDFIPARDGLDVTTTLDVYVQTALEHALENAVIASDVQNRAAGIVMQVKTGDVLAMATSPSFDLNDPYTLNEEYAKKLSETGLDTASTEYRTAKNALLYEMWRNKAISELYEPGSTFKIITSSIALETGAVTPKTPFSCAGYYTVGGCRISCHKRGGHGALTFAEGLMQSCNPVMMQSAERFGKEAFYSYFTAFGYTKKSGIDLPSEALGLFHSYDSIGSTELATASFGQRFKVSMMTHLCAVAAVANGGVSVKPHLLSSISEKERLLMTYTAEDGKRIISEETARLVASILEEGVSGDGGSKNAYTEGYRIAAKTGTSEKFDVLDANGRSFLRIGSCVAFAPYDDAEIAVILIVDEPTSSNKYGSVTAAPFVSDLLSDILPYLGIEKVSSEDVVTVPDLEGMGIAKAKGILSSLGIRAEVVGDGGYAAAQAPSAGMTIEKSIGRVILYTAEERTHTAVPSLLGKPMNEALRLIADAGLNASIRGTNRNQVAEGATVIAQSLPEGTRAVCGTVIEIQAIHKEDSE